MFAVPLFLITLFPLITPFSPFIWFIFGAWMYSLEYAEYPMGNHGLTFPQVRQKVRTKRVLSLSFGSIITLATMVPLLNFFVMPVSVAAATAMRVEQFPLGVIGD
jgi:CysZ protein